MIVNDEVSPGYWLNVLCGDSGGGARPPTEGYYCQVPLGKIIPWKRFVEKC